MAHRTSLLRAFAAFLFAFATGAQAQLYGVNPFQNDSSAPPESYGLFHLDPSTGAMADGRVITLGASTVTGAQSLARDPTTGLVYTILKVSAVSGRVLATINMATGVATLVGNLGDNFSSIAFRANGQLYGVTGDGASVPETLYLIDKTNAAKTVARALGNGADGELIAYSPLDDAFFHWSGNGTVVFERIEADPPYAVTGIAVTGTTGGESFGAAWDAANSRFLVHNISSQMRPWSTGGVVGAPLGSAGVDVRGMAFVPAPTVSSIARSGADPTNATSVDFLVTFSESMTGVDATDFVLTATGTAAGTIAAVSGSGTSWTVTVNAITGEGTLRLDLVDDDTILGVANALGGPGAGNGSFATGEAYTIDATAPLVTAVAVPANGTYVLGDVLQFTVTFDEAVVVDTSGGAPSIGLTVGAIPRDAAYVSGSGSIALAFSYTVQAGDVDGDGIVLAAAIGSNGGTLRDAAGNDAVLALNGVPSTAGILVSAPVAVTFFSGPSATGTGTITASFTGGGPACSFTTSQFIPLAGHARSPPAGSAPAGIAFPHGLFDFTVSGCTPGATITMTMTYPQALATGTQYWKYGPTPGNPAPHWYVLPATIGGSTATFSITDGSTGDDDLAANGTIVDQGGPGVPVPPVAAVPVPTLSEWMLALMAALMLLAAMRAGRRRR
jgi:trimeric autotransporter adhesin